MAADHRRSKVDALLEQETRQQLNSSSCSTTRLNSAWRHKVVHWYFKLVGALHRQNTTASSNVRSSSSPFNRTTVHISAHLLDNYIMSLPQEQAMRYRHNRPAYQLLATTCLLLGIRIAQHDAIKSLSNAPAVEQQQQQSCGMKRAKKCTNMSLMSAASSDSGPSSPPSPPRIAIPNATTILSMSAAPNSITEQNVLDMVKKLTSSRYFPRSKVVTALDYIYALSASSTQVSEEDGQSICLGPEDVEEASRITDTLLSDVNIISTPPSVVACAIITLALSNSRSNTMNNLDMTSIRRKVYYSIFGSKVDPDLQIATLRAETTVVVTAPPPRHRRPVPITTHHIIPFD